MLSESCCKQTVPSGSWWHSRCNICPNFFPWYGLQCSHYMAIQNTPPIHHAQYVKESYVQPASCRTTMRPRSYGQITTTGARCLGQSIAGWYSAPLWLFACENTCLHCRQWGYTVYRCDCLGTPCCDLCVSFALNLLSCNPTMINYLSRQFAIGNSN